MKNTFNLILLLTIVIFSSCKHKPVESVPFVCFESEVLPIFIANCSQTGCHGNGSSAEGYTLDSYNGIMKGVEAFNANDSKNFKVITSGKMPPYPNAPLTSDQIQTIKNWINGGANNTTGCDTSSVCDTATVTYSNQVASIMTSYCTGCHSGSFPQGGISLATYADVKSQINLGRFWGSVNWDAGYSAMPKSGNKLNACDLRKLKIWIDNGSQNN